MKDKIKKHKKHCVKKKQIAIKHTTFMTQVSYPKQITIKLFSSGPSCSKGG